MRYEDIVYTVRKTFENADARNIFEHIAIQVNVEGEGEGIFYFEVAERHICVEPYDYYDRDLLMITTGQVLMDLCDKKYSMRSAIEDGRIKVYGNERKLNLCLDNIKIS